MSLTGFPLILFAVFCTLASVAATVLVWNRFGRVSYVLRATGLLLAEVLLLVTFGLVVNRSEQFYPTWDTLLDTKTVAATVLKGSNDSTCRRGPGDLDHQLAVHAGGRVGAPQIFLWQSAAWRGWGLADAPTVITPPGYLQHPAWLYSAVVVIGDGPAGWTSAEETAAARRATATGLSAVVVFATTTAATPAQRLAKALPDQLGRDLRVTSHRWAIIASAADSALAQSTVVAATARYPSIAVLPAGARAGVAGVQPGDSAPATTTTGVAAAVVVSNAAAARQAGVEALPSTAPDALYTALSWAIERTPPPLAADVPPIRRKSGRPVSGPSGGHDGNPFASLSPRR
jgi:hypothetical protein